MHIHLLLWGSVVQSPCLHLKPKKKEREFDALESSASSCSELNYSEVENIFTFVKNWLHFLSKCNGELQGVQG